jgi:hypothetical protein
VEAIVRDVTTLVDAEQREPVPTRIGVLSPFRSQVEALRTALRDRMDAAAMERHDLRVGTAHAFQGEERGAMFVSWAVDGEGHGAARRFAERPDVFNVSVTRARSRMWSYASVDPSDVPADGLLGSYLRYVDDDGDGDARHHKAGEVHDRFAEEVWEMLREAGYAVWTGVTMAGCTMDLVDLVVRTRNGYAGIDLVGYPGRFDDPIPLERYRMLGRAGLRVVPLSFARWTTSPAVALEELLNVLPDSPESTDLSAGGS